MIQLAEYLEIDQIYSQTLARQLNTVAICASNSSEGVTTVATALAQRHANAGKKVLLVDMNYFRPSLDTYFAVARVHWALNEVSMHQAVREVAPNLFLLPASLSDHSQFRQSGRLQQALSQWQQDYDAVIFDTSPVNAINRHNLPAEQLCALMASTLLVVRTAQTKEADILTALAKLKTQQVNLSGWVMNDVECPALATEMIREIKRLANYFPRLARWLEAKVKASDLLNQIV